MSAGSAALSNAPTAKNSAKFVKCESRASHGNRASHATGIGQNALAASAMIARMSSARRLTR